MQASVIWLQLALLTSPSMCYPRSFSKTLKAATINQTLKSRPLPSGSPAKDTDLKKRKKKRGSLLQCKKWDDIVLQTDLNQNWGFEESLLNQEIFRPKFERWVEVLRWGMWRGVNRLAGQVIDLLCVWCWYWGLPGLWFDPDWVVISFHEMENLGGFKNLRKKKWLHFRNVRFQMCPIQPKGDFQSWVQNSVRGLLQMHFPLSTSRT